MGEGATPLAVGPPSAGDEKRTGRGKSPVIVVCVVVVAILAIAGARGSTPSTTSTTTGSGPDPSPSSTSASSSLESLAALVPQAAQRCGDGTPLSEGSIVSTSTQLARDCNWSDSSGTGWTLNAYQFGASSDAVASFNWLAQHSGQDPTPSACVGQITDCLTPWNNSKFSGPGQYVDVVNGIAYWVLPSQNALFAVNNSENLGLLAFSWFVQNVQNT